MITHIRRSNEAEQAILYVYVIAARRREDNRVWRKLQRRSGWMHVASRRSTIDDEGFESYDSKLDGKSYLGN